MLCIRVTVKQQVFWKKMFLKILQNSQENICQSLLFDKNAGNFTQTKTPVKFAKLLRTSILKNIYEWLLLK